MCLCVFCPVYLPLLSGPLDRTPPRLHDPPLMEEVTFPTAVRVCACVCVCVCVRASKSYMSRLERIVESFASTRDEA